MEKLGRNDIELYLEDSLAKLDLSDVEESQQEAAVAFAQALSSSVAGLTSNFLAGNWEINSQQKMISSSLYLGRHLYAVASPHHHHNRRNRQPVFRSNLTGFQKNQQFRLK